MIEFWFGVVFGALGLAVAATYGGERFGRFFKLVGPARPPEMRQVIEETRKEDPDLARKIEEPPAVPVGSVPREIDAATVNATSAKDFRELVRDPQLVRFLWALRGWRPRSTAYGDETGFGNSMTHFLTHKGGVTRAEIDEQRTISLELGGSSKKLRPDFILWDSLLVEVKGHVDSSSVSDRSLGQLFRYLLAWKSKGAAVLVICGHCDPVLKLLIRQYVDLWRERFRLPVTVYFAGSEHADAVPTETFGAPLL